MIKHFLGLACACIFFACSNSSESNSANKPAEPVSDNHCYLYNDTDHVITLTANYVKDSVTGAMAYDIDRQETNNGTFRGTVNGDILLGEYTFTSNGVTSVRQVAFKKSGSSLMGGMGEMEKKDGKMVFKDVNAVTYQPSILLKEVNCKE